mgnify:CR=1 FL=1
MTHGQHCKPWSKEDIDKLRKLYKTHTRKECALIFNRSEKAITSTAKRYGIKSGRTGYFDKGNVPFNKGKRQKEYMSEASIERIKKHVLRKEICRATTGRMGAHE